MQHHGDRLSKARVACLHGDKEKSLLLCSWTQASLSTVRLGAVSAAQEDGRGGDGSFQKRHHTPVQLDEVVRCSPPHDEERAAVFSGKTLWRMFWPWSPFATHWRRASVRCFMVSEHVLYLQIQVARQSKQEGKNW